MSRAITGDTITVKPSNNIYTALAGVALVIVILGLVVVWMRAGTLFEGGLFGT